MPRHRKLNHELCWCKAESSTSPTKVIVKDLNRAQIREAVSRARHAAFEHGVMAGYVSAKARYKPKAYLYVWLIAMGMLAEFLVNVVVNGRR